MNIAKCPTCNTSIMSAHFEGHDPGFRGGSISYLAVANPCGHAIGAVPAIWEDKLIELENQSRLLGDRLNGIEHTLNQVVNLLRNRN